ncbi:hypothetical protein PV04_10005 [Phialophora macrospora]|uniref:CHAT domain-containing protein n=1 Tax=Phialophora macrospora TaxID=1851006 RepID=A0A0D2F898_9EURO|nr:hypothetical protein PV04_10005 [Phialophora macrospora]
MQSHGKRRRRSGCRRVNAILRGQRSRNPYEYEQPPWTPPIASPTVPDGISKVCLHKIFPPYLAISCIRTVKVAHGWWSTRAIVNMPQVKPFGPLHYREDTHGWARKLGLALGTAIAKPSGHHRQSVLSQLRTAKPRFSPHEDLEELKDALANPVWTFYIPRVIAEAVFRRVVPTRTGSEQYFPVIYVGLVAGILQGADDLSLDIRPEQRAVLKNEAREWMLELPRWPSQGMTYGMWDGDSVFRSLTDALKRGQTVEFWLQEVQLPLIVLLVISEPVDEVQLRSAQAIQTLDGVKGLVDLTIVRNISEDGFFYKLRSLRPHIVHFHGHGGDGDLYFVEKGTGMAQRASGSNIITELERALERDRLQAAVLVACESFHQRIAGSNFQHHGSLIAMEKVTRLGSALKFSDKLYKCMGEGMGFNEAAGEAMWYAREWEARQRKNDLVPMRGARDEFLPRITAPTRHTPSSSSPGSSDLPGQVVYYNGHQPLPSRQRPH